MNVESKLHSSVGPRQVRPMDFTSNDVKHYKDLARVGIVLDEADVRDMMQKQRFGMDASLGTLTTQSIPNPTQFLTSWLPGEVQIITQVRNIDELIGIDTVGSWEDEEVVQRIVELTGRARVYSDQGNIPLSSWNLTYQRRTVVRYENGMMVTKLEDARAARNQANSGAWKREAATESLEIERNRVGFYGFNSGANRTFGFLNDPNLPAYTSVAGGVWSLKTFEQITADIRTAVGALLVRSGGRVDPSKLETTLALPTASVVWLGVTAANGAVSVSDWISKTYPKMRIASAVELDNANGGADVFYLYAETVPGTGSDGGKTFRQVVPAKFKLLGVEQGAKGYTEDYTNATAGVYLARAYAIVRYTGI